MFRQGDLLIVRISSIPKKAIKRESGILAEGEIAGHLHELDSGIVYEQRNELYFKVLGGRTATLNHPEHRAITFTSGKYKVIRQREYTPNKWGEKHVKD